MASTDLSNSKTDLREILLKIAREFVAQGAGYSQEMVVLREAAEQLGIDGPNNLREQQRLLTAWGELFRDGSLAWCYDIDSPGMPFFHFAEEQL
jgi:hypothetical protein